MLLARPPVQTSTRLCLLHWTSRASCSGLVSRCVDPHKLSPVLPLADATWDVWRFLQPSDSQRSYHDAGWNCRASPYLYALPCGVVCRPFCGTCRQVPVPWLTSARDYCGSLLIWQHFNGRPQSSLPLALTLPVLALVSSTASSAPSSNLWKQHWSRMDPFRHMGLQSQLLGLPPFGALSESTRLSDGNGHVVDESGVADQLVRASDSSSHGAPGDPGEDPQAPRPSVCWLPGPE